MRYLMFIKHAESVRAESQPKALMDAMGAYVTEGFKAGWLLDTAGLKGTADATRIRLSDGKLKLTDGPFTEAKEMIGGYALIEAKTNKEAVALATQFMELHRLHAPKFVGECEVRPLEDMG